jgi:Glycosyl hydrolases family 2, sugar binding domain/Glycosyl hydrolases family 2/Glycosyl hydrolases family 2, TIM barrel domain
MKKILNRIILACLCMCTAGQALTAQETISVAGKWTYKLDIDRKGEQEGWYLHGFDKTIILPGTLDDAGIGDTSTLDPRKLEKDILVHLTRKHTYIGYAWYSREINISSAWAGKSAELYLERVLWNAKLWIDGRPVGTMESISTPQRFNLSSFLQPGRHRITLRIDNTKQYDISYKEMAHAYTEGTQIIWNGVIGKMLLVARNTTFIDDVQVYPSIKDSTVLVKAILLNNGQQDASGVLLMRIYDRGGKQVAIQSMKVEVSPGQLEKQVKLTIPKPITWDEFSPVLYRADVRFEKEGDRGEAKDVSFGMREISNHNSMLQINGRRLFLRGTLECNIFPLTGHPPMDNAGWIKVFKTAKQYGLNHIRFHSWCPPEAAFHVADSLGIYVQVELPYWSDSVGSDTKTTHFLEDEAARISREYGNHPSFCLWSMGNELKGDFNWLTKLMTGLRSQDARHLYASTTFSFQDGHGKWPEPADDYYITQYTKKGWVRGQGIFNTYPPDFTTDYTKAIDGLPVPIITHEIGQYSVYPRLDEIPKYTGVLEPLNFMAVKNDLRRRQMLDLSPAFTSASGKLSANLYKEEIERALKTKGMSGFELLDLHDFPGQGTALVGVLDAFWDSKGLVTPEEHRMYCSAVVPLIRFAKAVYTSNEKFTAATEVANFSNKILRQVTPVWTIKDAAGAVVAKARLAKQDIGIGNGIETGNFSFDLENIKEAKALTIELALEGTSYRNKWTIWVYPQQQAADSDKVNFTTSLTKAMEMLREGKTVLLNPDTAALTGVAGRFAPVFWSPVHFPNQPGTMGILCDPKHPALRDFPTDKFSNWQWWDLVTSSKTMILDSFTKLKPVVRVIDNFFKNRQMATIIEGRYGNGKLLIVSMDISNNLEKRPAARQLRYSLERYMSGESFAPVETITSEQLMKLVSK